MEKRRFEHEFALLFLLALAVGMIVLQSNFKFTGNVISNGATCEGNWTCGDWTTCADSNQSRQCTLDVNSNSTCTSPVTEYQTCAMSVTNSTPSCTENLTYSDWTTCTDGSQTRTLTNVSSCGETILTNESQTCTVACAESWTCGDWTACASNSQTRTCTDANSCGTVLNKPSETQDCACIENWTCTDWAACSSGTKSRTCTDSSNCGTETGIPSLSHTCTGDVSQNNLPQITGDATQSVVCTPNWQCGDWQECVDGNQARACTDTANCGTQDGIPATSQACVVEIKETCSDKIKNQSETGVDCGGVCKKCSIFSMVGGVINGPLGSIEKVFSNKTNIFIASGAFVLVIGGFVCFKIFKKKKK